MFNQWITDGDTTNDYDICWLTLRNDYFGWMGFGYDDWINDHYLFNIWGYPTDKWTAAAGSSTAMIKWGHDDCTPTAGHLSGVHTNQLHYDCDTHGGMSGAGVWCSSNNMIYCVHSFGSDSWNGCARITQNKFNSMYDYMMMYNGWHTR